MSDDRRLQEAVLAELEWEPVVAASHIGVAAAAGVITLTGHVDSLAQKQAVEAAVRRVRGVKAVAEGIEVRLPFDMKRDDADIAAAVLERLAWDALIPADAVAVKVEKGWVTLVGEVQWFYQKDAAEQDVRRLLGVVGVTNQITIKSRLDTTNISDDIMHALHRSWFFDPKTITVTAIGGKVKLTGTTRSIHERQVAAATAWAAPGVTDVENDIVVV